MSWLLRPLVAPAIAVVMLAGACAASAQEAAPERPPGGLLDQIFRGGERSPSGQQQVVQGPGAEPNRFERIENQLRQLTGAIEQLQYRNQQLEALVRRMQEDNEYRFQELGAKPGAARPGAPAIRPPVGGAPAVVPPAGPATGRRGDAFDPSLNPNAPGAPRPLGALPAGVPSAPVYEHHSEAEPVGRPAGAPLDLTAAAPAAEPGIAPPLTGEPPARGPGAPGVQVATAPPAETPKDQFDLAYGYMLRHEYALAEDGFRTFLQKYGSDLRASEAQFWLGESLFQRQRYRDAAESFLAVSSKYDNAGKAPDALLRLGQSLAALGEHEMACATFGEVGRKFPRAPAALKQGVEREQKRARC